MDRMGMLNESVTSRGFAIEKVDMRNEKVLVYMPNNSATPYVIWTFDEDGNTFWGHYYREYEEALDYFKSVTK